MIVALYSQAFKAADAPHFGEILLRLRESGVETHVFAELADLACEEVPAMVGCGIFRDAGDLARLRPDCCICLGGDGTLLNALTFVRDSGIPLLGINLGRLGFLASIEPRFIGKAVESLINDRFTIEERALLQLDSSPGVFGACPWAINDFTILKRDTSSMITVDAYINGEFLNTYWADGLIVSTPTGSTGYSLSCGGPVVFPMSGNFVLTPVAPHNLAVRPVVIRDDAILSFQVRGRSDSFLVTLDSRHETITEEHQVAIRRAPFPFRLVQLHGHTFLATLREKLAWGRDIRN